MKVGFDGILLGCWAQLVRCRRVLDIGTGTGLIALIAAQRTEATDDRTSAQIDAIEIDRLASIEAQQNVDASPWGNRVSVFHTSLQEYAARSSASYDAIVCNPPYFAAAAEHKQANAEARVVARHDVRLSSLEVLVFAKSNLRPHGSLSIILPIDQCDQMLAVAKTHGLFCQRITRVYPVLGKPAHRVLLEFRRFEEPVCETALTIETSRHQYTQEFRELAKDFYLKF